ncbi:hypothetical protein DVH24_034318 [Malus domestica]|uniref:Uncharacterized protein n=1 Tax=Malus domestica TaxID=3750 RepID=A0A498IVL5_MALDO|nr:hypothetical protein DVH24_034318 [Malus domestica]
MRLVRNPTVKVVDTHQLSCTSAIPFLTKQNPHKALPLHCGQTVTRKMAWRSAGSLSRSLVSTARVSSLRLAPPLRRLRPPSLSTPRRLFASPRFPFQFLVFEHGRAGMHTIASANAQRDGCNLPHISPGCQCAGVLRVVTRYLLPHLSGSLVVALLF